MDVTNVTQTTASYTRSIPTLVFFTCTIKVEGQGGGDFEGSARILMHLDGAEPNDSIRISKYGLRLSGEQSGNLWMTTGTHYYSTPGVGTHIYKMRALIDNLISGTPELTIFRSRLTFVTLGT